MKDELENKKILSQLALIPQTMNAMLAFLKGKGNTTQEASNPVEGTSRFVKAEDTTKVYQRKSITKLSELINVSKDILKKKAVDWTAGLGKLLMVGGLLGFLFTGKTQFLTSMVKGFEKIFIFPIVRIIDKFVMKLSATFLKYGASAAAKIGAIFSKMIPKAPNVIKKATKIVESGGKLSTKLIKALGGSIDKKGKLHGRKGFQSSKGLIKEAEEIALKETENLAVKGAAKVGTKFGIKGLLKGGSKLGLKALAKIPILGMLFGPVLGIYFAVERYKKGDYIGALGEIASGMAMLLPPGVGTFLSLSIDAMLILRDFKSPDAIKKQNRGTLGHWSKKLVESIPIVSTVIHFQKMLKCKNKADALKEGFLAFGGIFGLGAIESVFNWLGGNKNMVTGEAYGQENNSENKQIGGVGSALQSLINNGKSNSSGSAAGSPINRLMSTGTNGYAQTSQQLNAPTGKMQNKYKFNAPWDELIDKETKNSLISGDVIRAMIMQESGGNPNADNGIARGIAQFTDPTAKDWIKSWSGPEDSKNPYKAIPAMVRFMEHLYKKAGGSSDPNAIYKAMYDYHGHSTYVRAGDTSSGNYVHEIASRMGESAPTGMLSSNQKAHRGAAYQFGTGFNAGAVAINSPAMAPSKLNRDLTAINSPKTQYVDPYMTELIKATKDNSITFKSALEGLSIKNTQTVKNGSAS